MYRGNENAMKKAKAFFCVSFEVDKKFRQMKNERRRTREKLKSLMVDQINTWKSIKWFIHPLLFLPFIGNEKMLSHTTVNIIVLKIKIQLFILLLSNELSFISAQMVREFEGCECGGRREGNNYNRPNPRVQLFNLYRRESWSGRLS